MTRTAHDRRPSTSAAVLWASAFVVAGMVITKAAELPPNAAYAGTAASDGDFSVTTASKGTGPDLRPHELLYVVDNRTEMLFIYDVDDGTGGRRVLLAGGQPLPALFGFARGR